MEYISRDDALDKIGDILDEVDRALREQHPVNGQEVAIRCFREISKLPTKHVPNMEGTYER
jgi:hypothetical protein